MKKTKTTKHKGERSQGAAAMQIKSDERETVNSSGRFKSSNTVARGTRGRGIGGLPAVPLPRIISRDRSTTAVTVSCIIDFQLRSPFE